MAETCNGADDDCDGLVDEGLAIGRLSVVPTPSILWPPNHRLVDVHVTLANIGGCSTSGGSVSFVLNSMVSDEPDNAVGPDDGNTVNDIQGALPGSADFDLQLRAERDGDGVGRSYEVAYTAVDSSGNSTRGTTFVFVPHDQGGITEPVVVSAENGPTGTRLRWDPVVGALSYRLVRGNVGSLREAGDFIDLGTVSCIQPDSSAASTVGHEDAEIPPLGQVFFYAVAYNDGRDSGYGTDSASKPRMQSGGDCFTFQARRPSLSPPFLPPGSSLRPPRRRLL